MPSDAGLGREYLQLDTASLKLDTKSPEYRAWENLNRALRQTWDRLDALEGRRGIVELGADINLNEHKVTNSADPEDSGDLVPLSYADDNYGPAAIAAALQIAGSNPLNVSQLRGVLYQPQPAAAPTASTTDVLNTATDGTLFVSGGVLYRVDATVSPPVAFPVGAVGTILSDTHANRANYLAADYPLGSLFYETDRTVLYYNKDISGTNTWFYISGTMRETLANKPTLSTEDEGFLFYGTDYHHTWRWSGSAWAYAPGDDGSGYYRHCQIAPNSPGASAWQLADGSTVARSNADTTTTSVTVPDLTGGTYLKAANAYTGTVDAANAPTISGNTGATSAGTPAGTVSAPIFTGAGGTTSGPSATTTVDNDLVVSTVAVASAAHTHTFTESGTNSAPTFTGSAMGTHTHSGSSLTVSANGEPQKLDTLVYYRR